MPISYLGGYSPSWELRDNSGKILAGGELRSYDANTLLPKPIYRDPAGTDPYNWPAKANGAGRIVPAYFADDAPYLLQCYDSANNFIWDDRNYVPPGVSGPHNITVDAEQENYFLNPQFRIQYLDSTLTGADVPVDIEVAPNFGFQKSNTSATDSLSFVKFSASEELVPENAYAYFHVLCSSAGSGEIEKWIYLNYQDVRTFQNQQITVAFEGYSSTESTLEVQTLQHFGTGGSPSADVKTTAIDTIDVTATWEKHSVSFVVPALTGKTIGTNGDDYVRIGFRIPLNAIMDLRITNIDVRRGNVATPTFVNIPANKIASQILIDPADVVSESGKKFWFLGRKKDPYLRPIEFEEILPVGTILLWPLPFSHFPQPADNTTVDYLLADGAFHLITDYPELFALYGTTFGGDGSIDFKVPDLRGLFLRGAGLNSLTVSDTELGVNRNIGRADREAGSNYPGTTFPYEIDKIRFHMHGISRGTNISGAGTNTIEQNSSAVSNVLYTDAGPTGIYPNSAYQPQGSVDNTTSETNPYNFAVNFVIAAR